MFVILNIECKYCVYLFAHAPIESSLPEDKDVFWTSMNTEHGEIMRRLPRVPSVLLINANARVNETCARQVGYSGGVSPNDNGRKFGASFLYLTYALSIHL